MRGRGQLSPPDFVQRIDQVAGRTPDAGLFPNNYWTPGRRVRQMARRIPKASIQFLLDHLDRRLRDVLGLNVRQPSSNVPPFRAQQILFNTSATILDGTALNVGPPVQAGATLFGPAQREVPEGLRGVLSVIQWGIWTETAAALVSTDTTGIPVLTVRKNNVEVPGFVGIIPQMSTFETPVTTSSGFFGPPFEALVPIKLDPGDTIQFVTNTNSTGEDISYMLRAIGWIYPIEVEADGVLGTLADRGSGIAPSGGGIAGR